MDELGAAGMRALDLLEGVSPAQREAVRAPVLDEREYAELAIELDCSEQVVRQRVSRGLRELRDLMEGSDVETLPAAPAPLLCDVLVLGQAQSLTSGLATVIDIDAGNRRGKEQPWETPLCTLR